MQYKQAEVFLFDTLENTCNLYKLELNKFLSLFQLKYFQLKSVFKISKMCLSNEERKRKLFHNINKTSDKWTLLQC